MIIDVAKISNEYPNSKKSRKNWSMH